MNDDVKQTRTRILELYAKVRVADVCDALDALGLLDRGSMGPEIRPAWTDRETMAHRMCGFAVTVRYFPTNRPFVPATPDDYLRIREEWQNRVSLKGALPGNDGDVMVIDGAGIRNIGYIGSANIMGWYSRGTRGVVTNAGCRDSDEIAKQGIPVYSGYIGHGRKIGRVEIDQVNSPVSVGGVLVCPGDFVVADGDGVIVVPAEHIERVGELALKEREHDIVVRKSYYTQLGLPEDDTVK